MLRKRKISNGVKKRKSHERMPESNIGHSGALTALTCLGMGVCLVLLCSCLSFDIGDWPSRFVSPNNDPVANWCGSIWAGGVCHISVGNLFSGCETCTSAEGPAGF